MNKTIRIILIIQFLSWLTSVITRLNNQPIPLVSSITIAALIFYGLWKATILVDKNPEGKSSNIKANVARWLLSFFFSIFAVEIGVMVMFLVRFITDAAYMNGNQIITYFWASQIYSKALIILTLIIAYPILYFINKALKFENPTRQSVIMAILWAILIFFIGPLLLSS